jgi:Mn2+/Fe2+ NRAMP family transporter
MGEFANKTWLKTTVWVIAGVVIGLNGYLLVSAIL